MRILSTACLVALSCLLLPSRADETLDTYSSVTTEVKNHEFDAAWGSYTAAELLQSGRRLVENLFAQGWPTAKDYQDALARAERLGGQQVEALTLWSGAGLTLDKGPLVEEAYGLFTGGARPKAFAETWKTPADCLAWKMGQLAELVQLPAVPAGLAPVYMPMSSALPEYSQNYVASDGTTMRWDFSQVVSPRVQPDALGFSLWAQALYAREALRETRNVGRSGQLLGRTAHDGFYGLLTVFTASNLVMGLNHRDLPLLSNDAELRVCPLKKYEPFTKLQYFPHVVNADLFAGNKRYLPQIDTAASHLLDQAALLLGLSEMIVLLNDSELSAVLNPKKEEDVIVPSTVLDTARDLARLIYANMTAQHFDLGVGSFDSRWTGRKLPGTRSGELNLVDAGVTLIALNRFAAAMKADGDHALAKSVEKWLKPQVDLLLGLQNEDGSFPNSVDIAIDRVIDPDFSLRTHGVLLQGLVAAEELMQIEGVSESVQKLLLVLDDRWMPRLGMFFAGDSEGLCTYTAGDLGAVLGGLRRYGFSQGEIRGFYRLKACIDGAEDIGVLRGRRDNLDLPGVLPLGEGGDHGAAPVFYGEVLNRFKD